MLQERTESVELAESTELAKSTEPKESTEPREPKESKRCRTAFMSSSPVDFHWSRILRSPRSVVFASGVIGGGGAGVKPSAGAESAESGPEIDPAWFLVEIHQINSFSRCSVGAGTSTRLVTGRFDNCGDLVVCNGFPGVLDVLDVLQVRVGEVVGTVGGIKGSMAFGVVLIRGVESHNDGSAWLNHVDGATLDCLLSTGTSTLISSPEPAYGRWWEFLS